MCAKKAAARTCLYTIEESITQACAGVPAPANWKKEIYVNSVGITFMIISELHLLKNVYTEKWHALKYFYIVLSCVVQR